jgi:hypothetical protein
VKYEPVHHTIVAMDIAGSGARDDQLQLQMRADLRKIVADALAEQALDPRSVYRTDLGDGVRLSRRACPRGRLRERNPSSRAPILWVTVRLNRRTCLTNVASIL